MKRRKDAPDDRFSAALEAINNLLLPEIDQILSGGWSAALAANSEIKIRQISLKSGAFHGHFLPLLRELVSALAGGYRRYFRLALAHPEQVGEDPKNWALACLQPFVVATVDWIRSWYMLACDGSNQYVRPVASIPFQPGQTVSVAIPLNLPETVSSESWRAPAWLFAIGPMVGIRPLKTENVPATDSEERLSAAHTRLLFKGVRRVFLWKLLTEIQTVRNEVIAEVGAVPAGKIAGETGELKKHPKHWLKGVEGLTRKADLSRYMHNLTDKQRLAFSLKHEYQLGPTEIASRMGIDRKTLSEHLDAANKRIEGDRSFERRRVNRSKRSPEE